MFVVLAGCGRIAFDPQPAPACGSISVFDDNFDDGVTDPYWIDAAPSGFSVQEVSGVLRVTMTGASIAAGQRGGYKHNTGVDVSAACATAELATVADEPGKAMSFGLGDSLTMAGLTVEVEAGVLHASSTDDTGNATELVSLPFDLASQRFVRLQHAGTTFFVEVSGEATGPFAVLAHTDTSTIHVANSSVFLVALATQTVAGGGAVFEWNSFQLVSDH